MKSNLWVRIVGVLMILVILSSVLWQTSQLSAAPGGQTVTAKCRELDNAIVITFSNQWSTIGTFTVYGMTHCPFREIVGSWNQLVADLGELGFDVTDVVFNSFMSGSRWSFLAATTMEIDGQEYSVLVESFKVTNALKSIPLDIALEIPGQMVFDEGTWLFIPAPEAVDYHPHYGSVALQEHPVYPDGWTLEDLLQDSGADLEQVASYEMIESTYSGSALVEHEIEGQTTYVLHTLEEEPVVDVVVVMQDGITLRAAYVINCGNHLSDPMTPLWERFLWTWGLRGEIGW